MNTTQPTRANVTSYQSVENLNLASPKDKREDRVRVFSLKNCAHEASDKPKKKKGGYMT